MVAKPLRTKPKSASAERCLRSLGATIDMATPDMETSNCPVRGVLSHGGLRKGNQEVAVITGFYRSPGIAVLSAVVFYAVLIGIAGFLDRYLIWFLPLLMGIMLAPSN